MKNEYILYILRNIHTYMYLLYMWVFTSQGEKVDGSWEENSHRLIKNFVGKFEGIISVNMRCKWQ